MKYVAMFAVFGFCLFLTGCDEGPSVPVVANDEVEKTCSPATPETPEVCICKRGTEATECPA